LSELPDPTDRADQIAVHQAVNRHIGDAQIQIDATYPYVRVRPEERKTKN
jgi:hypothetical protein